MSKNGLNFDEFVREALIICGVIVVMSLCQAAFFFDRPLNADEASTSESICEKEDVLRSSKVIEEPKQNIECASPEEFN